MTAGSKINLHRSHIQIFSLATWGSHALRVSGLLKRWEYEGSSLAYHLLQFPLLPSPLTHSSTYPYTHILPPPPILRYCIRIVQRHLAVFLVGEKTLPRRAERVFKLASMTMRKWSKRHRVDSNPCGQSRMDFQSISSAVWTQCLYP